MESWSLKTGGTFQENPMNRGMNHSILYLELCPDHSSLRCIIYWKENKPEMSQKSHTVLGARKHIRRSNPNFAYDEIEAQRHQMITQGLTACYWYRWVFGCPTPKWASFFAIPDGCHLHHSCFLPNSGLVTCRFCPGTSM